MVEKLITNWNFKIKKTTIFYLVIVVLIVFLGGALVFKLVKEESQNVQEIGKKPYTEEQKKIIKDALNQIKSVRERERKKFEEAMREFEKNVLGK